MGVLIDMQLEKLNIWRLHNYNMKTLIWLITLVVVITFAVFWAGISLELVLVIFAFLIFILIIILLLSENKFKMFVEKSL